MNDHLEIEVIWGALAVRDYLNRPDEPQWEDIEALGDVKTYRFNTEVERDAFIRGIREAEGWADHHVVRPGERIKENLDA